MIIGSLIVIIGSLIVIIGSLIVIIGSLIVGKRNSTWSSVPAMATPSQPYRAAVTAIAGANALSPRARLILCRRPHRGDPHVLPPHPHPMGTPSVRNGNSTGMSTALTGMCCRCNRYEYRFLHTEVRSAGRSALVLPCSAQCAALAAQHPIRESACVHGGHAGGRRGSGVIFVRALAPSQPFLSRGVAAVPTWQPQRRLCVGSGGYRETVIVPFTDAAL